jgi:hypothetical protein
MGRLMKKYPDDLEAASLYAVALLGTCQFERQYAMYMRAASAAEEVYAKNPQHPGASHYLIHSYDDPVHAPLGLRAASLCRCSRLRLACAAYTAHIICSGDVGRRRGRQPTFRRRCLRTG